MITVANCVPSALLTAASVAFAVPVSAETLFKIITIKDEIVVGLNDAELKDLGGDAGIIAKAIASKGSLSLWQYAVTQKDGERMMSPHQKIGVLANASLGSSLTSSGSKCCRTSERALSRLQLDGQHLRRSALSAILIRTTTPRPA
jgi:hypothetical protein